MLDTPRLVTRHQSRRRPPACRWQVKCRSGGAVHIGADSGQGRSSGGLSVGGDAVGVPAGVLCFRPTFFIALAMGLLCGRTSRGQIFVWGGHNQDGCWRV